MLILGVVALVALSIVISVPVSIAKAAPESFLLVVEAFASTPAPVTVIPFVNFTLAPVEA